MNTLSSMLKQGSLSMGGGRSFAEDKLWLLLGAPLVYVLNTALRLATWKTWDHPALQVNGEYIMATHDSYYWLAKAKGFGELSGYPLAQLTKFIHDITGLGLGDIGFWGPAFLASLVAVACFFFGWVIGGRSGSIFGGLAGALTPGFYFRTRLGYYDTDLFTLLAPTVSAMALSWWLGYHIRKTWLSEDGSEPEYSPTQTMLFAFGAGLLTRLGGWWHFDIVYFQSVILWFAAGTLFLTARKGHLGRALCELTVFALAAFPGMAASHMSFKLVTPLLPTDLRIVVNSIAGIILAAGLAFALCRPGEKAKKLLADNRICAALFLLVAIGIGMVDKPVFMIVEKLMGYLKPQVDTVAANGFVPPIYPNVVQSIIEASNIPLNEIMGRMSMFPLLSWISLGACIVVICVRPAAITLLPFLLVSLASVKLGARFSMFGGAALAIALGVFLNMLTQYMLRNNRWRELTSMGIQVAFGLMVLLSAYSLFSTLPPSPVVSKSHALALIQLGKHAEKQSMVWTWWDWGYATQYYAGLDTPSDGGTHAGKDIYPTALALTTDSLRQSNGIMRYAAALGYEPYKQWNTMPGTEVQAQIDALRDSDPPATSNRTQYIVVTWNDMRIFSWISFFGNWNLQTGDSYRTRIRHYNSRQIGYNGEHGVVEFDGAQSYLKTLTMLAPEGGKTFDYPKNKYSNNLVPGTPNAFFNMVSRTSYLMDDRGAASALCKLMSARHDDPEVRKYFKLVAEGMPFVRIYRVLNPAPAAK